jgi:hypothetical protein
MNTQQSSITGSSNEQSDCRTVSRRSFLSAGGATAVATGLAGGLQPALAVGRTQKKVRVAIAGGNCGTTFQFHEHPNCIVEAVADLIPSRRERLMKTYRCEKSYGHCFLTHEFIDTVANDRQPVNNLYEALAYTAPGIVAHESALQGGELLKIPSFDRYYGLADGCCNFFNPGLEAREGEGPPGRKGKNRVRHWAIDF